MSTTSLVFVFLFLPLSLALYYLAKDETKEYVLLFLSIVFYACGSLKYLTIFLISICITIAIGRTMATYTTKNKIITRFLLIIGIIYNVSILAYYKYFDFALSTYSDLTGTAVELKNFVLPLGISFFTFKAISYLADIYNQKIVLRNDPFHDALYLSFFGQVISGPLSRYNDMTNIVASLKTKCDRFDLFSEGVYRFMIGFNKKVLLSNMLANITNEVFSAPFESFSVGYAWLGSICFSLELFFDFSGYSDMAIGLSKMFGYNCPENFFYPYATESVSKFWRRWHITLGAWFRDYIYIPLGGSRVREIRLAVNLLIVWILTGIWHGSAWNFVIWGIGYFIAIAFEKFSGLPDIIKSRMGRIIYRVGVLLFINFQWVIFRSSDLLNGLRFIKRMFICVNNPLADSRTLFLLKDYGVFIVVAIILSFPIIPWIEKRFGQNQKSANIIRVVQVAIVGLSFVWAISCVISGLNNPFAYANF